MILVDLSQFEDVARFAFNHAGNTLPTATDALFGSGLGNAANALAGAGGDIGGGLMSQIGSNVFTDGTSTSIASAAGDVLPSATDVLFGGASSAASGGGGLMSEIGNVFSNAGSGVTSGIGESLGSAASNLGGSAVDAVADVASSAGDGIVDLVTDGIGSLLGSLFD